MFVDTPATIAILGAGPVGLEVALYARYLGYDVAVFEQGEVAAHVRAWGHVRMSSPFADLSTPLGLAAVGAQDPGYQPPDAAARLTGQQWVDQYLWPLAQTDLMADHIQIETRVLAVGRQRLLKDDPADAAVRAADRFRLLVERAGSAPQQVAADIVVDCTGVYGQPLGCGGGGIAARGEAAIRTHMEYGIPDVLGAQRAQYAGRRVLVVGAAATAAATIAALAELIQQAPQTRVTWTVHHAADVCAAGPLGVAGRDLGPERQRLADSINALAAPGASTIDFRPGTVIESIDFEAASKEFSVWFADQSDAERFDRVVAAVGHRPDRTLYAELRVADSPWTDGPLGLAADPPAAGAAQSLVPERLLTPEPNFYVLGAKSLGRDSRYLMTDGYRQIRDLFGMVGGRAGLDLYATASGLVR